MANIATVLKEEIRRLARKEVKEQTELLKRQSAQYRRDVASLKRTSTNLERRLALLEKKTWKKAPAQEVAELPLEKVRFSSKGLRSHRTRLGLSGEQYAKLLGVSTQTLYNWEQGRARPRSGQLPAIVALRSVTKKEALARLEQLG